MIKMRFRLRDAASIQQRQAHGAMPDHERDCRTLLLGERQKVSRQIANDVGIERHIVCQPETIEGREQQQRDFGGLSERFGLFDQEACPLRSRSGFR
jgi:hypothetical protein